MENKLKYKKNFEATENYINININKNIWVVIMTYRDDRKKIYNSIKAILLSGKDKIFISDVIALGYEQGFGDTTIKKILNNFHDRNFISFDQDHKVILINHLILKNREKNQESDQEIDEILHDAINDKV